MNSSGNEVSPAEIEEPEPSVSADPKSEAANAGTVARTTDVRFAQHRNHIAQELKQLQRELSEYLEKRDSMRRKLDDVDHAIGLQIADVDATIKVYKVGLNSAGPRTDRHEQV